jgi:hypothetical protein
MAKVRKTDPCPCGSGKKYKYCHGAPPAETVSVAPPRRQVFLWIVVALGPLAYAATFYQGDPQATAVERVWSTEHGHYHNVDGSEIGQQQPSEAVAADSPGESPGPAPPGKVWSVEHGHWHNDTTSSESPDFVPPSDDLNSAPYRLERPEGAPPQGKVWSESHGHWHDEDSP